MLPTLGDVPAVVFGLVSDILAWTPMGHAFLMGHVPFESTEDPAARPNLFKYLFCDPHARELFADWTERTEDVVACLRLLSGQHPDDPRLSSLVGDLSVESQDFSRLWAGHAVSGCRSGVRAYRHPLVGSLDLHEQVMDVLGDGHERLVIFCAEPGSPSDYGLCLLATATAL